MNSMPVDVVNKLLPAPLENGILGFNVSPLICKFRPKGESENVLLSEVAEFLRVAIKKHHLSVLLLPHVDPLDGASDNSDSHYMAKLLPMLQDVKDQIALAPATLNAPQLKTRSVTMPVFIGARTHATIGALSKLVPTISIAYSIKAKGLNKDLFGDARFVVDTPSVCASVLQSSLSFLIDNDSEIRTVLSEKIPEWKVRSRESTSRLESIL
jgi:colanic acid/amylovoran biosynthesis protein